MNIAPAHLEALEALGYTAEEARFLYIVATHSGLLHRSSIPRVHRCSLGQADDALLEQAQERETRPYRVLSAEWRGLPCLLAPALPPHRKGKRPQPPFA